MVSLVAFAAPEEGKYYRIINANYGTAMGENYQTMTVSCSKAGTDTDYEQFWQVVSVDSKKGLMNVYTGHYLQPQTNQSNQFKTGSTIANVTFSTANDGHSLMHCGGYLHCDAGANVVNWWDTSAEGDHWTFEEVALDDAKVEAAHAEYLNFVTLQQNASSYNVVLEKFFTDYSCSVLKSEYASVSDESLKTAMNTEGLPSAIQDIAVKVKNSWKDELDADISKQFRVQEYGAYSVASMWRWRSDDGRGLQASQINDMNNPTGIYTTGRELLYVFVDSDIPTGCELRFAGCTEGSGGCDRFEYQAGTTLKKGMNVISAGMGLAEYWVMYSLTDKTKKPADMPKIKIHVEGGHVMGYVNVQGKDEATANAEYKKVLLAANASANATGADKLCLRLAVKGNYGMFYWQIDTYNQIWATKSYNGNYTAGYRIYKSMKFYDDVLSQEWGLMGITKWVHDATQSNPWNHCYGGDDLYPTYCNNLAITLMGTNGGNPYSSTGYTHMPGVGAVESSYNAERADFDTWCVGHESGHNNQGTINLESSTESSNNLFSNVITYLHGYRMSRGESFADNQTYSSQEMPFGQRTISITLRMYYNLYLYYHYLGNNTAFYPTLFKALRKDPMQLGTGSESWLKFYKKACDAAKEDLTEYFRLWGFFIPCSNLNFGDYTSYNVTLTQKQIDAAIAEVKAKNYPQNLQIMFVEDRQMARQRTDAWAASETNSAHKIKPTNDGQWITTAKAQEWWGNVGDVLTYNTESGKNGNYTYTGSGTSIKLNGEGGVGFLVYDENDNIVWRSNKYDFTIPAEVAKSNYTIRVINSNGTSSVVVDAAEYGTAEQKKEALQDAINASKDVTNLLDETGKKVGYYNSEALQTLVDLVAQGNEAIKNNDEAKYYEIAKQINAECLNVMTNGSQLQIKPTGIYTIQSYRASNRYLSATASGLIQTATSKTVKSSQWLFIPAGDGTYYLQNYNSKKVMQPTYNDKEKLNGWSVSGTTLSGAFETKVKGTGKGQFYIEDTSGSNCINLNGGDNSSIAVWSEDDGSKWYITQVGEIDYYTKADLKNLVASSDSLINAICSMSTKQVKLTLQADDKTAPYYISTNKPDSDTEHGVDKCVDNKATTYFMSDHTLSTYSAYLTVDLGENNDADAIKMYYSTNSAELTAKPTAFRVQGSANGATYTNITTFNTTTTSTTKVEAYSSDIIQSTKPYRYWRFTPTATNSQTGTHYFALSKFVLYQMVNTITMKEGYENVDNSLITAVNAEENNTDTAINGLAAPLNYYDAYIALKKVYDALVEGIEAASADDIQEIQNSASIKGNGAIYDLTGRRVQNIKKGGLYIQNGKTFIAR